MDIWYLKAKNYDNLKYIYFRFKYLFASVCITLVFGVVLSVVKLYFYIWVWVNSLFCTSHFLWDHN